MKLYHALKERVHRALGIPKEDWKVTLLSVLGILAGFAVVFTVGLTVMNRLAWAGPLLIAVGVLAHAFFTGGKDKALKSALSLAVLFAVGLLLFFLSGQEGAALVSIPWVIYIAVTKVRAKKRL